jgi:Ca2+-binding EF-hand superfamily protein
MGSQFAVAEQREKGRGGHFSRFMNKFDNNNDNIVSKEEFTISMKQRFNKMDANGNGVVSQEEFQNKSISRHEYERKKIKTKSDKKNDGFLTEKENTKNKLRFKKKGHYFHKIDKNGDGEISYEENIASLERLFNRIDSNNDEMITQDEIKAMGKRHHGKNQ